ncbi:MAG: dTMP kinase [Qingshengfaniella sp.]
MSSPPGLFITFEGVDGCGKSTQARMLAEKLQAQGMDVVLTREPGGSPGAEDIRALLVNGEPGRWSPETEILLFTAARRDHWERTIHPALMRGATVVCDRFVDSTRIYQGTTRGDLTATVDRLHDLMIGAIPQMTFVIDLTTQEALRRSAARGDTEQRFETFGLPFQEKLRQGFCALAATDPRRVRLIDGTGAPEEVAARVCTHLPISLP